MRKKFFSSRALRQKQLTGRAATVRLFPLTLCETLGIEPSSKVLFGSNAKSLKITRTDLMRHLDRGGMPGFFYVHEKSERSEQLTDWLQLTTQRDIQQLPGPKKDSVLAQDIL